MWRETIGYVWGQRNEQSKVPIENVKQRQTYYGVMNLDNQEFFLTPYERGNSENTVCFMKDLQTLHPDKKIIILWDKASYHGGQESGLI